MKNIVLFATLLFISNSKAYSAFRTLEADYITNVFSQSNFVKNPNARVNTQGVTASTGFTVSRAIITPLYDTSEFNLSSTSATGTIDWATRTLDAGMKGQNCEARFTYRGFTGGTTKAQIVQGANTVATLDLLSSTDPKQVSINFPCGDLTQATVFRINRTIATLSGTNEIGGIYLGLATNMANVAQAEFVGSWRMIGTAGCTFSIASTSFQQFPITSACNSPVTTGSVLVTQGKRPWIDISNPKAGNYYVIAKGSFHNPAANQNQYMRLTAVKSAGNESSSQLRTYASASSAIFPASLSMNTSFSSGTLGFVIEGFTSNAASAIQLINDSANTDITFEVYRFPTASELVVKPENQENYWAAMRQSAYLQDDPPITSSTYVQYPRIDNGVNGRVFFGKASADLQDYFVLTVPSLPVGSYKVSFKGMMIGSTSTTLCSWALHDGTGLITDAEFSGLQYTPLVSAIYNNSKIQSRTFALWGKRVSGTGFCIVEEYNEVLFTLEPLDGKSSSALYVQGPVLGAQTGAAIPSGYVGESKKVTGTIDRSSGTLATYVDVTGVTFTVEAGTWLVCTYGNEFSTNTTTTNTLMRMNMRIRNVTDSTDVAMQTNRGIYNVTHSEEGHTFSMCSPLSVTSTKTISTQCSASADIGSFTFGFHHCAATMSAIRLN